MKSAFKSSGQFSPESRKVSARLIKHVQIPCFESTYHHLSIVLQLRPQHRQFCVLLAAVTRFVGSQAAFVLWRSSEVVVAVEIALLTPDLRQVPFWS